MKTLKGEIISRNLGSGQHTLKGLNNCRRAYIFDKKARGGDIICSLRYPKKFAILNILENKMKSIDTELKTLKGEIISRNLGSGQHTLKGLNNCRKAYTFDKKPRRGDII
jgi:hypothetical protein